MSFRADLSISFRSFWVVATAMGAVGALAGAIISFVQQPQGYGTVNPALSARAAETLIKQVDSLDARVQTLSHKIDTVAIALAGASQDQLVTAGLADKVKEIDKISNDLDSLKQAVMSDPVKALALPLLQKDVSEVQRQQVQLEAGTAAEVNRIYDFSKWFLALMITLVIGLVTMGFFQWRGGQKP